MSADHPWRGPRRALATLLLACALAPQYAQAAACGPVPATYPAYAAHTLDIKSGTINATTIVDNAKNALSTGRVTPIPPNPAAGQVFNTSLTLPPIHPLDFPANDSKVDTSALSIPPGAYRNINTSSNPANPTVFTAAGVANPTWYVDKLTLGNAVLAPGVYFVGDLNASDGATLVVNPPGEVRIYVDRHIDAKDDVSFNAGGAVANLQVYLDRNADARFDKNATFTGLIYGTENNNNIEFKDNARVTGALIAGHDVKIGSNATLLYDAATQAAVAAISTCLPVTALVVERAGGGPIASQTVGLSFSIQVTAKDAYGNTVSGFAGPVTISSTGTMSQGAGTTSAFADGVLASWPVTLTTAGTFTVSATAAGGLPRGTSNSFVVGSGQCSAVPSGYATYGGTSLLAKKPEVNGVKVTPDSCAGCNSFTSSGGFVSAALALPLVDPFESSSVGGTLSSSGTLAAGDYGTVNGNNLTFSGGTYRIRTFNSSGTSVFNAGTYYIDVFNGGTGNQALKFTVASGPVRILIGSFMGTTANGSQLNRNGAAADLQILLEPGATFSMRDNTDMSGFIYGSATDNTISFRKDLALTGAIVSAGLVSLGDKAKITYGSTEQGALASVQVCTPPVTITVGPFNAFESSTPAGAVSGVIQTRVAGQSFALDLVAVNAARTAIQTAFVGAVTVELVDASDNSGLFDVTTNCRSSWTTIQTLAGTRSFAASDAGRITVAGFVEPNAWRNVRVRITWQPTGVTPTPPPVVGCSNDNFAVRPASFSAPLASDANWLAAGSARTLNNSAASGGVVHAAGAPFQIGFAARDAAGNTLASYNGVPTLAFDGCALPSPCAGASAASLSAGFAVTGGVASSTDARYDEAGAFVAHAQDASFAAVDAADTPAAQRLIASAAATIGRFVPANYLLALANTPTFAPGQGTACTGDPAWNFTWFGQPFSWLTAPLVTITAQTADGLTLAQYAGSLFKLSAPMLSLAWASNAPVAAPLAAAGQTVAVTSTGAGTANASFGTSTTFSFTRPTTPIAPLQAIVSLTVTLADTSETGVTGNAVIPGAAPLVIDGGGAGIDFQGGNASGANLIGYGRLQVMSTHGDSRRNLPMRYETQMWSGSAWYRNQRDSCVQPPVTSVALSNWGGALAACDVSVVSVSRATRGQGTILLAAPVGANVGGVDVTMRLGAASGSSCVAGAPVAATSAGLGWLLGPWTSAPNYTSDPAGRATFGRLRVTNLIRREVF